MDQRGSMLSAYSGSAPLVPPSAKRTFRIRASIINIYPVLCRATEERHQWQNKLSKLLFRPK